VNNLQANCTMASATPDIGAIVRDPAWLAHRYDPGHDAFHFRRVARDAHRAATFLTDEYLGSDTPLVIRRADVLAANPPAGPLHFIFHSAFCGSTLLARAFDLPGRAMGLKEPVLLNDIIGWQLRGGTAGAIGPVIDASLRLLARPFAAGEAIVIKPSNIANGLAPAMLAMRPASRALLLFAPLRVYLGSVARKGLDGRLWVRDLLMKQLREGLHPFGFSAEDYLGQTDLQVAAMGWLAQQALFVRLIEDFGAERIRSLDSEMLMADPASVLSALATLYGINFDHVAVSDGPVFRSHSKFGTSFDATSRAVERAAGEAPHADEIDKVELWAGAVANSAGISVTLAAPLLG
jgi:hypothetical protein